MSHGGVAHFGDNAQPATTDFYQSVLFFVIISLTLCLCLGVPGSYCVQRGKTLLILLLGLFFGATILVLQFSPKWETASVETELVLLPRRHHAGISRSLNHSRSFVNLYVALRGINVTYTNHGDEEERGSFHFNERFEWAWSQGRNDFGPFAGSLQRQYRDGQKAGFPTAILKVANVFTLDGEGIRYGRLYRTAGLHVHYLIWSAFMFWIMALLCMQFSVAPGAYFLALSGSMLLLGNIVWFSLSPAMKARPPAVLLGSAVLKLQLGPAFYLCLFTGFLAVVLAIALILFEARDPIKAAAFFGLDPRNAYDEYYCNADEVDNYVTEMQCVPASPKVTSRRRLSKIQSLDIPGSLPAEGASLIRSATIDSGDQGAKEQILLLRRRNNPIPSILFSGDFVRPRLGTSVSTRPDGRTSTAEAAV